MLSIWRVVKSFFNKSQLFHRLNFENDIWIQTSFNFFYFVFFVYHMITCVNGLWSHIRRGSVSIIVCDRLIIVSRLVKTNKVSNSFHLSLNMPPHSLFSHRLCMFYLLEKFSNWIRWDAGVFLTNCLSSASIPTLSRWNCHNRWI